MEDVMRKVAWSLVMHGDGDDGDILKNEVERSTFAVDVSADVDDDEKEEEEKTGQHAWKMWGGWMMEASANCCQRFCESIGSSRGRLEALSTCFKVATSSTIKPLFKGGEGKSSMYSLVD